eukprot:CAMPEP_0119568242 /NCGR_PEP_ID=MMETSP1352-20130426/38358_1 /TAXON_ID=265584 /ORGANISM="Stauroneis constricta, Strain CCMP1120" /LENGTH=101 /DNA_ID=CAMNT_0007617609 /DNA_START=151 /DNA_END=453 /DNA_ORIENTATION=-
MARHVQMEHKKVKDILDKLLSLITVLENASEHPDCFFIAFDLLPNGNMDHALCDCEGDGDGDGTAVGYDGRRGDGVSKKSKGRRPKRIPHKTPKRDDAPSS